MFNIFKKGRKPAEAGSPPDTQQAVKDKEVVAAPGTGITYKKTLLDKYKEDHRRLLSLYGSANDAYKEGRYRDVSHILDEMQDALRAHLLDEELNFYIYLQHCYNVDKETLDLISDYKKDMKKIGLTAFEFLKKYSAMGDAIGTDKEFPQNFETIGQTLGRRINSEENYLYPLYRHPSEFQVT